MRWNHNPSSSPTGPRHLLMAESQDRSGHGQEYARESSPAEDRTSAASPVLGFREDGVAGRSPSARSLETDPP